MFSSRKTREITTPSDPSYVVTIRQLSGRRKERCQQAVLEKAATLIASIGGAAAFGEIQKIGGERAVRDEAARDPGSSYDQQQVLIEGIVGWTADEPLTPETIADLEVETGDLLFREILRLSRVAVTSADVDADADAAKNA